MSSQSHLQLAMCSVAATSFTWLAGPAQAQTATAPAPIPSATAESAAPLAAAPNARPLPESRNDPEAARQEARQRFEAGTRRFDEGDYELALLEFERAYALVPEYRVLYNIAQVSIQLGRHARAVKTLRQYLRDGGDSISPTRRATVLADLDTLMDKTATLTLNVNLDGARIDLDQDTIATSPVRESLLVDAGEHRLTVRKTGYVPWSQSIALAGRDQRQIHVTLEPEPAVPAIRETVVVERRPLEPTDVASTRRYLLLTAGWVGTGLLAGGWVATGYLGVSADRDRKDALARATTASELASLEQKAKNWYLASDVIGGVTIAAAATMTYFTLFGSKPADSMTRAARGSAEMSLRVAPGHVAIAGRF